MDSRRQGHHLSVQLARDRPVLVPSELRSHQTIDLVPDLLLFLEGSPSYIDPEQLVCGARAMTAYPCPSILLISPRHQHPSFVLRSPALKPVYGLPVLHPNACPVGPLAVLLPSMVQSIPHLPERSLVLYILVIMPPGTGPVLLDLVPVSAELVPVPSELVPVPPPLLPLIDSRRPAVVVVVVVVVAVGVVVVVRRPASEVADDLPPPDEVEAGCPPSVEGAPSPPLLAPDLRQPPFRSHTHPPLSGAVPGPLFCVVVPDPRFCVVVHGPPFFGVVPGPLSLGAILSSEGSMTRASTINPSPRDHSMDRSGENPYLPLFGAPTRAVDP